MSASIRGTIVALAAWSMPACAGATTSVVSPVPTSAVASATEAPPSDADDVTGFVTDEFGVPQPGREVRSGFAGPKTRTDADGRFRIAVGAERDDGRLRVSAGRGAYFVFNHVHARERDRRLAVARPRDPIEGSLSLERGSHPPPIRLEFRAVNPPLGGFEYIREVPTDTYVGAGGSFSYPAAEGVWYEISTMIGADVVVLGVARAGEKDVALRMPDKR